MKKKNILLQIVFVCILLMFGCSNAKSNTYNYDLHTINYSETLYITKTVYYNDRVEFHIGGNYYDADDLNFSSEDDRDAKPLTGYKKLILYSDNPDKITSLDIWTNYYQVSFRYLNTDQYATIWCGWADDLGWTEYEGNTDKYYTEEEKQKQRELEAYLAEQRRQARETDIALFDTLSGKWVSDDGEYFDITGTPESHKMIHNYPDGYYPEEYPIMLSGEDNLYTLSYAESGWGLNLIYDIELSEDGESFVYRDKTFLREDEKLWENVDAEYIYKVRLLLDNAQMWEKEGYKYAVTDLDLDGYPEVIVSGPEGDEEYGCSYIYEVNEEGIVGKISANNLSDKSFTEFPPNLYRIDTLYCYRFKGDYKYLVDGSASLDGEGISKKYYYLSVQYDSVVLETVSFKEEYADKKVYYDEDEEISSTKYAKLMDGLRAEAYATTHLEWFDDITKENMAESLKANVVWDLSEENQGY